MKTINYGRQFIDDRDFNLIKKSLGEKLQQGNLLIY